MDVVKPHKVKMRWVWKELIPNEVSLLQVVGHVSDTQGVDTGIDCHRAEPVEPPHHMYSDGQTRPDRQVPTRLRSDLPPPGSRHLKLCLDEFIAHGRVGAVYAAKIEERDPSLPPTPPLVVKVAFEDHSDALRREAWAYEEMEWLQGSSVARCYGLFEATLPDNVLVKPWEEHSEDGGTTCKKCQCRRASNRKVVLLLLERLGSGKLPLGEPIPEGDKKEIRQIYKVLARLGLEHFNIRRDNILRAPDSPDSLPSLKCPFRKRTFSWRIVDFEGVVKTNSSPRGTFITMNSIMERLFLSVAWGDDDFEP